MKPNSTRKGFASSTPTLFHLSSKCRCGVASEEHYGLTAWDFLFGQYGHPMSSGSEGFLQFSTALPHKVAGSFAFDPMLPHVASTYGFQDLFHFLTSLICNLNPVLHNKKDSRIDFSQLGPTNSLQVYLASRSYPTQVIPFLPDPCAIRMLSKQS